MLPFFLGSLNRLWECWLWVVVVEEEIKGKCRWYSTVFVLVNGCQCNGCAGADNMKNIKRFQKERVTCGLHVKSPDVYNKNPCWTCLKAVEILGFQ
jgi:hypothetical protein